MPTIAEQLEQLTQDRDDLVDNLTTKGITGLTGDETFTELVPEVLNIPSGGGTVEVEEKDVNFYDYDGTRVYSYTASEFANLTELPLNPSHNGLTAQGWNWSLQELREQNTEMNVGQMYIPNDGKTHLIVEVDEEHLTPNLAIGLNGTAIINWGDDTSTTTLTGSNINTGQNSYHTYSQPGKYEVTIEIPVGSQGKIRGNQNYVCFLWKGDDTQTVTQGDVKNRIYGSQLKELYVGERMQLASLNYMSNLSKITLPYSIQETFENYAFANCNSLEYLTIPKSITTLGGYCFTNCYKLKKLSLPSTYLNSNDYAFVNCTLLEELLPFSGRSSSSGLGHGVCTSCKSLKKIIISGEPILINTDTFYECYSLKKIFIPKYITSISDRAFSNCKMLERIDFSEHESIPTIANDTFYSTVSNGFKIIVPDSLYSSWITASNWSSISSYIVKASEA